MKQTRKKKSKNVMHNYFKLCHQHICDITFNVSTHMIRATSHTHTIRYNRLNISMRFILVVLCDVVNSTGQNEEAKNQKIRRKISIFMNITHIRINFYIMIQFSFLSFFQISLCCVVPIFTYLIFRIKVFFPVFIKQKL